MFTGDLLDAAQKYTGKARWSVCLVICVPLMCNLHIQHQAMLSPWVMPTWCFLSAACAGSWGLTLFTPFHVDSILQLPQTLSTFFPSSCDSSFCPQLLPMSSLNDSPNISRQPGWWKELMLVKLLVSWWTKYRLSDDADELSIRVSIF